MGKQLKTAFLATLPVMAGYVVLGTGFGILLSSKGYNPLWTLAMSVFIYAGSMRHLFYGISMIGKYQDTGKYKPYLIFALTDETYSLNCGALPQSITDGPRYYFLVSLFNHCYWVLGSLLGAVLGYVIPFSTEGIDFALTALFVTVFVEQWLSTKDHIPALIGLTASTVCLIIFGPDGFLIPAMVLITLALAVYGRKGGNTHD